MKNICPAFFIFLSFTILLSCNNEQKPVPIHTQPEGTKTSLDVYNQIRETLKGASIAKEIIHSKAFYFSSNEAKDTIMLIVQPGLISESKSEIKLVSSAGDVIYAETFATDYLAWYVFEPEKMPQQVPYEQFIAAYANAITKTQIEAYVKNRIKTFWDDLELDDTGFKEYTEYGEIIDKEAFDEITAIPNRKLIWLPCLECDEGSYVLGYSKSRNKAIRIISSD